MKILDLFCCAGGASMGMHFACPEAEIVGVDIEKKPSYPFTFVRMDALEYSLEGYDFIWASPPCHAYAIGTISQRVRGKIYPDLVAKTRERLLAFGVPFAIENVPKAPLRRDLMLCGSMFGLRLVRHRIFECSFPVSNSGLTCNHASDPVTVCGHGTPSWVRKRRGSNFTIHEKRAAMGIDWCNRNDLSEAIPPAYSRYILEQWLVSRREAVVAGR